MNEIKCPNCGEVFTIDENAYASIVKQIRDSEFQSELAEREKMFKNEKDSALALVKTQLREENEKSIFELKQEIARLQAIIDSAQKDKQLEINSAVSKKDREIAEKNAEIIELKGNVESAKKDIVLK